MKKRSIALAVTALTAVVITVGFAMDGGDPAPYIYPIGTKINCCCDGQGNVDPYGTVTADGHVLCKWVGTSDPADPLAWADVVVADFSNTQVNPQLGTLKWTLDDTRELVGRIEANQAGAAFPATAKILWHANVEIGDRKYRTLTPVEFNATINSWPTAGTTFNQVGSADLESLDNPGQVAISLVGTNVTIQSNDDPCP